MRELLKRICGQLVGISYDDLTIAERNIVDLLVAHDYLIRNGNELSDPEKKRTRVLVGK